MSLPPGGMTEEQRRKWREWFGGVLELARYLPAATDPDQREYLRALATRTAIPYARLRGFLRDGHQPTPVEVRALAETLGLHPLSVAYVSGYYSLHDLAAVVGSGHIPNIQSAQEELAEADELMRLSGWSQTAESFRRRAQEMIRYHREFAETFGIELDAVSSEGAAAEVVKCEIVLDQTPITAPGWPVYLEPPTGVIPVPEGTVIGTPGPTLHRRPEDLPDA